MKSLKLFLDMSKATKQEFLLVKHNLNQLFENITIHELNELLESRSRLKSIIVDTTTSAMMLLNRDMSKTATAAKRDIIEKFLLNKALVLNSVAKRTATEVAGERDEEFQNRLDEKQAIYLQLGKGIDKKVKK